MTELNKDVLRLWVEDLETTTDRQGTGYLAEVDTEYIGTAPSVSYCCLGRLCKLAVENGVIPEPKIQPSASGGCTVLVYGEGADANDMTLPAAVMKWAGLHDHDPILDDDGDVAVRASEFNDCYGKTFREIAGLIRDRFGL